MTPARKRRLTMILLLVGGIALASTFILKAFQENMNLYYEPSRVNAGDAPIEHNFRMGGIVKEGSIKREKGNLTVQFDVTDYSESVTVYYEGILPDLFREGQGIITLGQLNNDGRFIASEVLAKHDENYMPPEVAESLAAAKAKADEKSKEATN